MLTRVTPFTFNPPVAAITPAPTPLQRSGHQIKLTDSHRTALRATTVVLQPTPGKAWEVVMTLPRALDHMLFGTQAPHTNDEAEVTHKILTALDPRQKTRTSGWVTSEGLTTSADPARVVMHTVNPGDPKRIIRFSHENPSLQKPVGADPTQPQLEGEGPMRALVGDVLSTLFGDGGALLPKVNLSEAAKAELPRALKTDAVEEGARPNRPIPKSPTEATVPPALQRPHT